MVLNAIERHCPIGLGILAGQDFGVSVYFQSTDGLKKSKTGKSGQMRDEISRLARA